MAALEVNVDEQVSNVDVLIEENDSEIVYLERQLQEAYDNFDEWCKRMVDQVVKKLAKVQDIKHTADSLLDNIREVDKSCSSYLTDDQGIKIEMQEDACITLYEDADNLYCRIEELSRGF